MARTWNELGKEFAPPPHYIQGVDAIEHFQ